jgi:hypothetical protein
MQGYFGLDGNVPPVATDRQTKDGYYLVYIHLFYKLLRSGRVTLKKTLMVCLA